MRRHSAFFRFTVRPILAIAMFGLVFVWSAPSVRAQIPDEFTNLKFLPEDISRDSLLTVMRDFSFALGVRCQYCHVGGDGRSFEGVEFHKDDDPNKRKARFMLGMVADLNAQILPSIPDRDDPPVRMECKSCHRGLARPLLLKQQMRLIVDEFGSDSAAAWYRDMRERNPTGGSYDWGEWETNVLAERLDRDGQTADAIAMYMLNAEFNPNSVSIQGSLAGLFLQQGDTTSAIERYERILEIRPGHRGATERLAALRP